MLHLHPVNVLYLTSAVTWRMCVAIFLLFCFSLNVLSMLHGHFWYLLDSGRNNVHMTLGPDLSLLMLLCYLKLLADHPRFNLRENVLFPLINLILPRFNLSHKAVAALLLCRIPSSALYGNFILCFRSNQVAILQETRRWQLLYCFHKLLHKDPTISSVTLPFGGKNRYIL